MLFRSTRAMGTKTGDNDNTILARYLLWSKDSQALSFQVFYDRLGKAVQFNVPPNNSRTNTGEAIIYGLSGKAGKNNWFFDMALGPVQRYSAGNQVLFNIEAGLKMREDKWWLMFKNIIPGALINLHILKMPITI